MNQDADGATQRIDETLLAGRYRLLDKIGEGGAAEVFRARDVRLDRVVAIKILRRQFVHDQASRARFINEARSAAGLAHPNIIDVYDFGEAPDGSMFIAMHFVEGNDLKSMLQRRGRMSAAETVSIATQVCAALSAAHARGLIHRDVKPQNILVDRKGHARLGDFGIVKALSGPELTQTGMTFGTAAYLSPEQATGEPIGPASDVYALGCVMYEMLAGVPPFTGDNPAIVAYKQVWEQPRPLHDHAPEVPPSLENVIMRCLQKDPRARYPNTDALAADLLAIGASNNQPTMAVPVAPPVAPAPSHRRTLAEVSQQIPMAPQVAGGGGVPPVRAQTTGMPVGQTYTPPPAAVPQTRRVTQPQMAASQPRSVTVQARPASPTGRSGLVWALLAGMLIVGLGLCGLAAMTNGGFNFLAIFGGPTPTPTTSAALPTSTPSPTRPPLAPTFTPVPPTDTPAPTDTPLPTEAPTEPPTNTPEPPAPTDTPEPEPLPTDTPEPFPTDTPEPAPFPTDTPEPEPFPTDTPSLPPGLETPTPENSGRVTLEDSDFVGGYTNDNGLYHGRTAQWVYGQGTPYNTMLATFLVSGRVRGNGTLSITGLDSEDQPKTPILLMLNGTVLYQGPNPLPNDNTSGPEGEGNWGTAAWRIPNRVLQEGENLITITNLDPSNRINYPIFMMVDSVTIEW